MSQKTYRQTAMTSVTLHKTRKKLLAETVFKKSFEKNSDFGRNESQ